MAARELLSRRKTSWRIPAFGNWNYCDEIPVDDYFGFAMDARVSSEEDLFKVPVAVPVNSAFPCRHRCCRKVCFFRSPVVFSVRFLISLMSHWVLADWFQVRQGNGIGGQKIYSSEEQRKQGRICRAPNALDEDLYKIPPELLFRKPKRVSLSLSLFNSQISQKFQIYIPKYIKFLADVRCLKCSNISCH
ncbi:hypothetical protein AXF42_Ash007321 [Apostasia shenzhenica]|uniref:Uncharacterized protein n=1 Tax=Apostasia shenzhenica TaxID=1088818 RepID=A0A2I0B9U9_9ASPA|nr:hypothetical protein AXF42_Ash007321 [Apostasia shenzhenica]